MVQLVGIVNVTPDSFSDGGVFLVPQAAIEHAEQLFAEGAAIVDIGAESTRPNATELTDDQEWERLEPVLKVLVTKYPGKISVDSYHPKTIERALALGVIIVNDVTGLQNTNMQAVVLQAQAKVIISHLPRGMRVQEAHKIVPIHNILQVKNELLSVAKKLETQGLPRKNIILDPGIGFGKTAEVNHELLSFAKLVPNYKVMIGYSRKRFLGDNRMDLEPNLQAGQIAIAAGAAFLRVHDVAGHAALLK